MAGRLWQVDDTAGAGDRLAEAPSFSPDGSRLALSITAGPRQDLYIYEPERDLMKFTFDDGNDSSPVWTPDSEHIIFASARGKPPESLLAPSKRNGAGDAADGERPRPVSVLVHPSGKYLAFTEADLTARPDLDIKIFRW